MVVVAMCGSAAGQDTVRLTLDSCMRYAYGHNLTVQTAELSRQSAQAALKGAKLNFLPSVSASASQGVSWSDQTTRSGNYGVSGSLVLFDGLSNVHSLKQARLSAERSNLARQQAENSVGTQIVSAYLTIMMNEEKLAYQCEVLETSHQQQLEGELKYRVGRILESDYKLLEANYISAQSEIDNTMLTIESNRLALRTLLCMDGGTVVDVVRSDDSLKAEGRTLPLLDTVMAQAERTLPDWQMSNLEVDIARNNVELSRASFMPSLNLNAGTSYNEGTIVSDNPVTNIAGGLNTSVTLGLSIPIFNRGTSLTQLRQSKISLQQAELENRQTMLDLRQEIENQYLSTQQSLNRFRSSEALADAYHASYDVYVLKYAEGAVTTVEMLQQQDKYLSALNDYLQNKYSYLLAEKQLDIYTGKEIKL